MPNYKLQKTLHDYLAKIKHPPHPQVRLRKILSGCKHPKTPSFALDGSRNIKRSSSSNNAVNNDNKNDAATLADVDRFLFENFKSLYFKDEDDQTKDDRDEEEEEEEIPKLSSLFEDSPRFAKTLPDLTGSTRFFVKSGNSGSLVEDSVSTLTTDHEGGGSSNSSTTSGSPSKEININAVAAATKTNNNNNDQTNILPDNCIALLSYSPSPYEEFRRSMQDVVETRYGGDISDMRIIDWDFMEEVLFCYLNLNEKKSHKFILSAFVDLITVMRRKLEAAPAKPCSVRTVRINGRELRKKKTKQLTIEYGSS